MSIPTLTSLSSNLLTLKLFPSSECCINIHNTWAYIGATSTESFCDWTFISSSLNIPTMPCTYPHGMFNDFSYYSLPNTHKLNEELDHACYWAGYPEMAQKTKEYEERAKAIVERGAFRDGTKHPWMESGFRGDFRVQLFEFQGTHNCQEHSFENPRDLLLHFEDTPKDEGSEITTRRLIILEDMDPRFVELLGVKLEIPPEFFLAHCEEFVNLSIVDRVCTKQSNSTYWKVPVRQKRCFPTDFQGPYGTYILEPGSFSRFEIDLSESSGYGYLSFNSYVSYWGKTYEDGSWTGKWNVNLNTIKFPNGCKLQPFFCWIHTKHICT